MARAAIVRTFQIHILAGLLLTAGLSAGCSQEAKHWLIGTSMEIPQSEAIDWGRDFKMRITKCAWEGPNLVVGLSMTYSGNTPAVPGNIPVFQLKTADDKKFNPSNGAEVDMQLLDNNYNPDSSVNTELRFPAPRGQYKLLVEDGGERRYVGVFPASGPVHYVWLITPTGT